MSFEIAAIFAFAVTGIFLFTVVFIYSLMALFRLLSPETTVDRRVSRLFVKRVYYLSRKPLRTAIRVSWIDIRNRRVGGTLIVALPYMAEPVTVTPLNGWYRFTVTYRVGRKTYSPTWYFDIDTAVRLDGYWEVHPDGVETI